MSCSDKPEASGLWIFQAAASEGSTVRLKHQCCQHLKGLPQLPQIGATFAVPLVLTGESRSSIQLLKKAFGNLERARTTSNSCSSRLCSRLPTGQPLPSSFFLSAPVAPGWSHESRIMPSMAMPCCSSLTAAGYHRFGRRFIKCPTSIRSQS